MKRSRPDFNFLLPGLLVLLALLSAAAAVISNTWVRREISGNMLSLVRSDADNMDFRLSRQAAAASNLMTSIYPYISSDRQSDYDEYNSLSKIVNSSDMSYIPHIYVPDSKSYSSQRDIFFPLSEMNSDEILCRYVSTVGISWPEMYCMHSGMDSQEQMIACVFTMNRMDDYTKTAGSVVLFSPLGKLDSIFEESRPRKGSISLVSRDGRVIAGDRALELSRDETGLIAQRESGCVVSGGCFFAHCNLKTAPWCVVLKSDASAIDTGSPFTILPLILRLLMVLVITAFAASVYSSRKNMESSYKEKLEKADYQMQALQEQIKPHFLYNTLDIIKWMIIDGRNRDAADTINALSRYLRMSISRNSGTVSLKDETELAQTYIKIIRNRFRDKFTVETDIAEDTLSCAVPHFVLQPVIENALVHGILYCDKSGLEIRIRSWREDGKLFIEVEDNGNGIQAQKLDEIRSGKTGYGLRNTRKRLELFSGDYAVFDIQSKENIGTCVCIQIKAFDTDVRDN